MRASILVFIAVAVLALTTLPSALSSTCNAPTSCPASPAQVPTPWFNLDFSTPPASATNWAYNSSDAAGDSCNHTGLGLTGQVAGDSSGGVTAYIDLNAATGAQSAGKALPQIGKSAQGGSFNASSAGFTYEITFKPQAQTSWAKMFCIGNGAGVGDIILGMTPQRSPHPPHTAPSLISLTSHLPPSAFPFPSLPPRLPHPLPFPSPSSLCVPLSLCSLVSGYNGGNLQFDFTIDTGNGLNAAYTINSAGNLNVIPNPNVVLNTWYHIVIVVQQVDAAGLFANYFAYVNGVLQAPNLNNAALFNPPDIARPLAYLGRSCYSSDQLLKMEIDAFRVYNQALNAEQVTAIYSQQMGGCPLTFTTSTPVIGNAYPNLMPNATTPIAPVYSLNFSADPRAAVGTGVTPAYTWETQDAGDVVCGISQYHQGLVLFAGSPHQSEQYSDYSYINMTASSGPNAVTAPNSFPALGGTTNSAGTAALGTAGLSIEVTFKPALQETWAKLFDIGASRNSSNQGTCNADLVFGWYSNSLQFMNFEVCDPLGNGYTINNFGPFLAGQWYHVVIVLQQLSTGQSNWYAYVNGQVLATSPNNNFFPVAAARQWASLGKSGWDDSGWSGYVDTFNIYNQALSTAQVTSLYQGAMGPAAVTACPFTPSTTSVIPASAIYYNLNFTTNPAVFNPPAYGWVAVDPTDTPANQALHTGLVNISGCIPGNCNGAYINMSAPSGNHSVGLVLGDVGGIGTGSINDGSVGWSFEYTFKAFQQVTWAKLMDLGDGVGTGLWEIIWGWHNTDQFMNMGVIFAGCQDYNDACPNLAGGNTSLLDDLSASSTPIQFNTWYHVVVVMQYSAAQSQTSESAHFGITYDGGMDYSAFNIYINGVLAANATQNLYPAKVSRIHSLLGRSNYGDNYWQGLIDTFRIYSISLNANQVQSLYAAAMQPPPVVSSTGATPRLSSSAAGSSSAVSAPAASSVSAVSAVSAAATSAPAAGTSTPVVVGTSTPTVTSAAAPAATSTPATITSAPAAATSRLATSPAVANPTAQPTSTPAAQISTAVASPTSTPTNPPQTAPSSAPVQNPTSAPPSNVVNGAVAPAASILALAVSAAAVLALLL